jgi:hypothetical protein
VSIFIISDFKFFFLPFIVTELLSFHILEGAHYARELETLDVIPATESRPEPIKLRASPGNDIYD